MAGKRTVQYSETAKEQCSCISIVVPSKTEWLGTKKRKQHEYFGDVGVFIYNEELEIKQGRCYFQSK